MTNGIRCSSAHEHLAPVAMSWPAGWGTFIFDLTPKSDPRFQHTYGRIRGVKQRVRVRDARMRVVSRWGGGALGGALAAAMVYQGSRRNLKVTARRIVVDFPQPPHAQIRAELERDSGHSRVGRSWGTFNFRPDPVRCSRVSRGLAARNLMENIDDGLQVHED